MSHIVWLHIFPQLSQGRLFRSVDHFRFPCMCLFLSLSPTILTMKTFQNHCDPLDVHLIFYFSTLFSQLRLTWVWFILEFLTILTTKIALCFFKCFFKRVFSPHFSLQLSQERFSSSVYHFVPFDICSLFHLFHIILTITSLNNHVIPALQPRVEWLPPPVLSMLVQGRNIHFPVIQRKLQTQVNTFKVNPNELEQIVKQLPCNF